MPVVLATTLPQCHSSGTKACGYVLENEWLAKEVKEHFGPTRNALEAIQAHSCIVSKLLDESGLTGIAAIRCVRHAGTVKLCIVVAESIPFVKVSIGTTAQDHLLKLRNLLGTSEGPRWYTYD